MLSALIFLSMLLLAPLALPGEVSEPSRAEDAPSSTAGSGSGGIERPMLLGDLDRVLDGTRWPLARWSVLAVSLERGDTLFARSSDDALIPASNVKLLTTAAALYHLGSDFRFQTYLLSDAPIENGVLRGDLVLYGTGDPALSDRFFRSNTHALRAMVEELKRRGVHTVEGDIVGDGTFFSGPPLGPEWNSRDLNDWFAAPVSSLSFNENVFTLRVTPGFSPDDPAVIHTIPQDAGIVFVNQARTVGGAPRRPVWASRSVPTEPIVIEGELGPQSADVWRVMTVPDPPLFASTVLRRVLEEEGVVVEGAATALRPGDVSLMGAGAVTAPALIPERSVRILATHHSPPLIDLLGVVNRASHNLYAELIFMTLGRIVTGEGSFRGGAEALRLFMEEKVGVEPESLILMDGSGLSRRNRVSAGAFVETMTWMSRSAEWDALLTTLPVAGERRGLSRMYRSAAAGNLRAKTGTIDRVSGLTGTVTTADGERVGFSILVNDVPSTSAAKRIEDLIGIRLASFRRPASDS